MKSTSLVGATILTVALTVGLAGCSEENEMSQEDIQYLSHIDQSRFFQRQGELKASTLEARSAIELKPQATEPYFLILDNLLQAGDALNAERQLNQVMDKLGSGELDPKVRNRAILIRAEANLMQGEFEDALSTLEDFSSSDRPTETRAAVLTGRIHLAANQLDSAEKAFRKAQEIDPTEVESLVGLSKTAFASGDEAKARSLISEAENLDAESTELWLWKAQLADHNQEWQMAEDAYIRALEDIGQYDIMTQRKYATISALIRVLRAQGKQSEAYVYEEILAKSAPGTIKSNLVAAQDALDQGDLDEAARYLEEVLNQAPSHEQSALMLGLVRFRQGRVDEAEQILTPIAEAGKSETASKLLAATKLQQRNPEGAQEILDKLDNKDSDPNTLAMVAIAALASGDFESGEQLMDQALAGNPDNHDLRLRYAAYLSQTGQHERAIEQAGYLLKHSPQIEQARSIIIQSQVQSGYLNAAKETADRWIEQFPESNAALIMRGNLAAEEKDYQAARDFFSKANAVAPESPAAFLALGKLAAGQDQLEQAREHFREAVRLAPDNRLALQGLAAIQPREETDKFMRQILDSQPEAIGPRLLLLESALRDGNEEEADKLTAVLVDRKEQNIPSPASALVANIYNNIALALRSAGQTERAAKVLERARVLFPSNEEIAIQAAGQAFAEARENDARKILQEVKQQHPDSAQPYATEAAYFENSGDYQQAADLYRLAMEKEASPELANSYARNLQSAGQPSEALAFLESVGDNYPDSAQLLFTKAILQQSQGNGSAARASYEKLLESNPENVVVLNNLAWIYHEEGDKRAIELARRAYELNPDNGAIADTYGWIQLQSGNPQASIPLLEKAHKLNPESEEIALHLAEAYRAVGKNSDAQKVLEKFGDQG